MAKLDPVTMAKNRAKKRARQKTRVEMAIRADELLNFLEPEIDNAIEVQAALGNPYEMDDLRLEGMVRDAVNKFYPRQGAILEILFPDRSSKALEG